MLHSLKKFTIDTTIEKKDSTSKQGHTLLLGETFKGEVNYVTHRFIQDNQFHGGDGGKRSKLVLNLRATIVFFGSMLTKANTLLKILRVKPGTTNSKPKTITLSHGGSMPRQFLEFDSKTLYYEFKIY